MTGKGKPCPPTAAAVSLQLRAEACGSASTRRTARPCSWRAWLKKTAVVVLLVPPLRFTTARTVRSLIIRYLQREGVGTWVLRQAHHQTRRDVDTPIREYVFK